MKLESQVCSLELARRLKELGVNQESFWHWQVAYKKVGGDRVEYLWPSFGFSNHNAPSGRTHKTDYDQEYAAFTVAELGEMLPDHSISGRIGNYEVNNFFCQHAGNSAYGDSEAESRARMLIHLIENGLIRRSGPEGK